MERGMDGQDFPRLPTWCRALLVRGQEGIDATFQALLKEREHHCHTQAKSFMPRDEESETEPFIFVGAWRSCIWPSVAGSRRSPTISSCPASPVRAETLVCHHAHGQPGHSRIPSCQTPRRVPSLDLGGIQRRHGAVPGLPTPGRGALRPGVGEGVPGSIARSGFLMSDRPAGPPSGPTGSRRQMRLAPN
ncbi:hypothetical protein MXAN_0425 [Myxococcus xanthus DK 1622]|uniref:Uncharacterized protein n=1 Tax=Myxococcus xanthus (strain DK1622) TaxID=246197 RepID=Q1DF78_MYXXD|nr:hypothetical protein MXAN_0425 [Myxococcus xanthus DK 1622]